MTKRMNRENVGSKSKSGATSDRGNGGSYPQAGWMAPTDTKNNIRHLRAVECNTEDI